MKIAHLLPASARFPITKHNGRYEWVLRLALLQAKSGHSVVLYCGPSSLRVDTPNLSFASLDSFFGDPTTNNIALLQAAFRIQDIDVFHSHFDYLHYFVARQTDRPIIYTQHWFPSSVVAEAAKCAGYPPRVWAVPVTHYMAAEDERLGIPATVPIYHGIDLERFQYTEAARSDRFIFVGRVAPHKGVKEAIDLAKKAGVKLDIIGKVNKSDQPYWAALSDEVDGKAIRYLGALPQAEVVRHLQTARALLFPSQQLEAFGQTIVEAQACGTPVITSDLGGARELVVPGKTGFIASNTADYINAIGAVGALDPLSCRKQAERFDVRTMLGEYHKLYSLLGR